MDEEKTLVEVFEANREHLRRVAYRMLGSGAEVDDAVQEAWLRLARADASGIDNVRAWLTTVVARICLDILRARKARREAPLETALETVGNLFKQGKVGKTYWAVVEGGPGEDTGLIDLPLGRRDASRGWWMKVDPDGLPGDIRGHR